MYIYIHGCYLSNGSCLLCRFVVTHFRKCRIVALVSLWTPGSEQVGIWGGIREEKTGVPLKLKGRVKWGTHIEMYLFRSNDMIYIYDVYIYIYVYK